MAEKITYPEVISAINKVLKDLDLHGKYTINRVVVHSFRDESMKELSVTYDIRDEE